MPDDPNKSGKQDPGHPVKKWTINRLLPIGLGLLLATSPLHGQNRSLAVQTGVFNFDLSGTGNSPSVAVSADWAAMQHVLLEAAMTITFPDQQFGDRTTFVIPEALIQYQWTRGKFAP